MSEFRKLQAFATAHMPNDPGEAWFWGALADSEDLARETYVMETARVRDLMRPTLNRETARAHLRDATCYGNGGE